jgi:hypothetical protein
MARKLPEPIGKEITVRDFWYIVKKELIKLKKMSKEDRKKYNGTYFVRSSK